MNTPQRHKAQWQPPPAEVERDTIQQFAKQNDDQPLFSSCFFKWRGLAGDMPMIIATAARTVSHAGSDPTTGQTPAVGLDTSRSPSPGARGESVTTWCSVTRHAPTGWSTAKRLRVLRADRTSSLCYA